MRDHRPTSNAVVQAFSCNYPWISATLLLFFLSDLARNGLASMMPPSWTYCKHLRVACWEPGTRMTTLHRFKTCKRLYIFAVVGFLIFCNFVPVSVILVISKTFCNNYGKIVRVNRSESIHIYLHAPHSRPSVETVLTSCSTFFMSVSSSQGFTSRMMLLFAISRGSVIKTKLLYLFNDILNTFLSMIISALHVIGIMFKDHRDNERVTLLPLHGILFPIVLVPASAPRLVYQKPWFVLSCLWDDAYKRTLAANREGFLFSLSEWSFTMSDTI